MTALRYTRAPRASARSGTLDIKYHWLWQIAFALIIFSASGAGYYSQDVYTTYLSTGSVSGSIDADANPLSIIGTLGSIAAALLLPLYPIRKTPAVITAFFLFQIYIAISGLWSFVPKETALIVVKTTLYAMAITTLVTKMSYRSIVIVLIVTAVTIALISLYLSYTNPIFATSLGTSGWRGLFSHKNRLAAFCLFMILLIAPAFFLKIIRWPALATVTLLLITSILSQGKTAIATVMAFLIYSSCLVFIAKRRDGLLFLRKHSTLVLLFVIFVAVPLIFVIAIASDVTFTGRVGTWAKFMSLTADNRLFGLGGYTMPSDTTFADLALRYTGTPALDSSFISLLCNFGIVGILLYFIFLAYCWKVASRDFSVYSIFSLFTVLIYPIYGAMESDAQLSLSLPSVALIAQLIISQRMFDSSKTALARRFAPSWAKAPLAVPLHSNVSRVA